MSGHVNVDWTYPGPRERWADIIDHLANLYHCPDWRDVAFSRKEWKKLANYVKDNRPPPNV